MVMEVIQFLSASLSYLFMAFVLKVKPYLPHEWTPKGMLERVNAFSEYYVSAVRRHIIPSTVPRPVYIKKSCSSPSHLLSSVLLCKNNYSTGCP